MNSSERKKHWESVFETKDTQKVSWYQKIPETSIKLIESLKLSAESELIEIGSGDGFLADFLLKKGFQNITLLDVSEKALYTVKNRLKNKNLTYIISDILEFHPPKKYLVWHDRAVFHFLTSPAEIGKYLEIAVNSIETGGYLIVGTFSDKGPEMCSGLKVEKYN